MLLKLTKAIAGIDNVAVVDDITSYQFFWLYTLSNIALLITGWFLLGWLTALVIGFFLITNIFDLYKHKDEITSKATAPMMLAPLFITIAIVFIDAVHISITSLIDNKTQAHVITGVVPSEHEYVSRRRGSSTYLNVDGVRMHCDINNHDACDLVYAHAGKTATIYYYDRLAYEIDIEGQKIYEFDAQLAKFHATKNNIKQTILVAFILFGAPALIYYFICIRIIRHLILSQAQDEEAQESHDPPSQAQDETRPSPYHEPRHQPQPSALPRATSPNQVVGRVRPIHLATGRAATRRARSAQIKSRIGAGGWAWRILFGFFGVLTALFALILLIVGRVVMATLLMGVAAALYYAAKLPLKNAKEEVTQYQQMQDDGEVVELSELESMGFYNHMGVLAWVMMYVLALLLFMVLLFVVLLFDDVKADALVIVSVIMLTVTTIIMAMLGLIIRHAINKRDDAFG